MEQQGQGINDNTALIGAEGLSVRSFGAVGDGVTDDTAAILAAITAAKAHGKTLVFPNLYGAVGHYLASAELDMSGLRVEGEQGAILDFTGASVASFSNGACVFAGGALTALPDLNANVAAGDTSIVFANSVAGSLFPGSVFAIYDPTDSSFNPARTTYRAGEWCRVSSVSGATITVDRPLRVAYVAATVENFRLDPTSLSVQGLEVRGIGTTTTVAVIEVDLAENCRFVDLELSGTQWAHLLVQRVVGAIVSDVRATDYGAVGSTNYGVAVDSCQDINICNCRIQVQRHAVTLSNVDADAGVPSRNVTVSDCFLVGNSHTALDAHGSAEDYKFVNCQCHGGITAGGDRALVAGCYATGSSVAAGPALHFPETIGADFTVTDCTFEEGFPLDVNRGLIDWGGNSTDAIVLAARAGSRFLIKGNRINLRAGLNAMSLRHRGTLTSDVRATISENIVRRSTVAQLSTFFQTRGDATHFWRSIEFIDNACDGVGIFVQETGAEDIQIRGGQIRNAGANGIRVEDNGTAAAFPWGGANGTQSIIVEGVQVRESWTTGIRLAGWDLAVSRCKVLGCLSLNNSQVGSGSSSFRSSLYMADFEIALMKENTFGDGQAVATQVRTWAADFITTLVESDTMLVGTAMTVNTSNIGR